MKCWHVIVEGKVTEHYYVDADTQEEAMDNWSSGSFGHSEAWDCEAVSAT